MNKLKYISILLIFLSLLSCEDVIDVNLIEGRNQIVVDGWINNQFEKQRIRLVTTNGYFDTSAPPLVENATVQVIDLVNNKTIDFIYDSNGYYTWTPPTQNDTLIVRQRSNDFEQNEDGLYNNYYKLIVSVEFGGEDIQLESYTSLERTPSIDSLVFKTSSEENEEDEKIYGELWAKDFVGPNDCYWIKTYKNGSFLNKRDEMLLTFDITPGRSDYGNVIDEDTYFIPPVRSGINPSLSEDEVEDNAPLYSINDTITVEIHSMTEDAFDFLSQARSQMANGGLFASPLANVPTNIIASNSQSEGIAVGIFCGSAISSQGYRIKTKPPYDDN